MFLTSYCKFARLKKRREKTKADTTKRKFCFILLLLKVSCTVVCTTSAVDLGNELYTVVTLIYSDSFKYDQLRHGHVPGVSYANSHINVSVCTRVPLYPTSGPSDLLSL